MIGRLYDLSVWEKSYAILFAQCAKRFPEAMFGIPKPEYRTGSPAITYSYQPAAPQPPTSQPWSVPTTAPVPTPSAPAASTGTATSFFRFGPRPEACAFCCAENHRVCDCAIAGEYVKSGCASIVNDRIHLPNGQPVPFDGSRRGLKASIDTWLNSQIAPTAAPAQSRAIFTRDTPPHFDPGNASTSRIEEVVESHVLQVKDSVTTDEEEFPHDIFEVFATKKKQADKASKAPELSAPPLPTQAPNTSSGSTRPNTQYRYQSNAEDQQLTMELEEYLMKGKLLLTMPAHVLAASPAIRKNLAEKLKVRRVETNEYEVVAAGDSRAPASHRTTVHDDTPDGLESHLLINDQPPAFCLPLQEIDVLVNSSIKIPAILDTGSQINVIRYDLVQLLGACINFSGSSKWKEPMALQTGR